MVIKVFEWSILAERLKCCTAIITAMLNVMFTRDSDG
jgi:hypothetical protein